MHRHRHIRVGVARALICALALVAQSTLLPLLHGLHGGAARLEHALAFAHAGGAVEPGLHDDGCVPAPSHDAATCALCATLAGSGTALAPDAVRIAAPSELTAPDSAPRAVFGPAPSRHQATPRGPPALLS